MVYVQTQLSQKSGIFGLAYQKYHFLNTEAHTYKPGEDNVFKYFKSKYVKIIIFKMSEKKIYKFWYLWLYTHKKIKEDPQSLKQIKFRIMDDYERSILANHYHSYTLITANWKNAIDKMIPFLKAVKILWYPGIYLRIG